MLQNQSACFRFYFDSAEKDWPGFRPWIQLQSDDSLDAMYLNGRRIERSEFASAVRPGRNVLAVKVRNSHGSAGLLFRVFASAPGGGTRIYASDSSAKCSGAPAENWFEPDFDDSAWTQAHEIGDVTTPPWARLNPHIVRSFMTDAEWNAWQKACDAAAPEVPAGIAAEPEPDARIVYDGWLPKISLNGKLLEPDFSLSTSIGISPYQDAGVVKLDSLGFPITRITMEDFNFWKGEGTYDFSRLDWRARRLLKIAPNAHIEIFLEFNKMTGWCKLHPDETVGYATGPADPKAWDDLTQRVVRPSAASKAFREEAARVIAALGEFVRSKPWGKRAIAVRLGYGIYTEWHAYGMYEGPDSGPAMTQVFRKFLRRKYGGDDALAKAWNDPSATIDAATPPTMDERGPDVEVLDRARHRKALDFFLCNASASADTLLFMARKTKEALPGRLVGAYYGYVFGTHPPEGTNLLVDKVLSSPAIDFLSNPASYLPEIRRAGGAYNLRNIPATFHRYGKLCVCEDDMRFHHALKYEVTAAYATQTPEESKATVKRNYLNRLFDGIGYQALDLSSGFRPAAFDDPAVLEGIYEAKRESSAAGDPGVDSGNDLAVVIDWRGRLVLGNKAYRREGVRVRYDSAVTVLYRTGVTFDTMTLDDYLATRRRYGHVLFLNPAEADPALMAKARERAGKGAIECDDSFKSVARQREIFDGAGIHSWTKPGSYVRRHGSLLMFHTGESGRHEIALPAECTGALSLATGRSYDGRCIAIETPGPHTELFKLKLRTK